MIGAKFNADTSSSKFAPESTTPPPGIYTESWISCVPLTEKFAHAGAERSTWLIFTPRTTRILAEAVGQCLKKEIAVDVVSVVAEAKANFMLTASNVTLDPHDLAHHQLLAKEFPTIAGVISLWGLCHNGDNVAGYFENEATRNLVGGFLNTLKFVTSFTKTKKFMTVTKGALWGAGGPLASNFTAALLQGTLKTFVKEYPNIDVIGVDLDPTETLDITTLAQQIVSQLGYAGKERQIAIHQGQSSCPRLVPLDVSFPPPEFKTPSFPFALKPVGAGNQKLYKPVRLMPVDPNETVIKVHSISPNFLQVAIHRELLSPETATSGCDFAGVIEKVGPGSRFAQGDRVCGAFNRFRFIENYVTLNNGVYMYRIPDWMSYDEASTLGIPLGTAYFGVFVAGKLKQGDHILIHTASGGFGLAVIQIAKHVGATVYATAGSEKKRNYLREVVGVKYVYNSRDTNFEREILEVTGGEGIDLVVNTITSEGFKEASLNLVRRNSGGRFLEMSKINTWTVEEVQSLRPDVEYAIYDLHADRFVDTSPIEELVAAGFVRGMPYRVKPIDQLAATLNEFGASKHIGKFVLQMSPKVRLFHAESSYLVSRALNDFGLAVAGWLLEQGAGKVILSSHSEPSDSEILKKLEQFGDSVVVISAEIGEKEDAKRLFQKIKNELPPLKGVFHLVGISKNQPISELCLDNFEETLQRNVATTWNLHKETLTSDLDHFVLISSAASNADFADQAATRAIASFLDTFAKYRQHHLGLPATVVSYGSATAQNSLDSASPSWKINALERVLRLGLNQAIVMEE